jgi:hypothetical protein
LCAGRPQRDFRGWTGKSDNIPQVQVQWAPRSLTIPLSASTVAHAEAATKTLCLETSSEVPHTTDLRTRSRRIALAKVQGHPGLVTERIDYRIRSCSVYPYGREAQNMVVTNDRRLGVGLGPLGIGRHNPASANDFGSAPGLLGLCEIL